MLEYEKMSSMEKRETATENKVKSEEKMEKTVEKSGEKPAENATENSAENATENPTEKATDKSDRKGKVIKFLVDILFDILGGAFVAAGVYNFASASDFPLTGFTGISMIINRLTGFPMGIVLICLNIPVGLIASRIIGKRYFIRSIKSMVILSLLIDYAAPYFPVFHGEKMLAAICTGVLSGIGYGLIYSRGSSTGGTDFITLSIKSKKPYMSIGNIAFVIDACIVAVGTLIVSKNVAGLIYGMIIAFIASTVVDKILYGLSAGKMTLIVTEKADEVAAAIDAAVHRGSTFLKGQGSYTGANKNIVMCACGKKQMYLIQEAVKEVDPKAFMIIMESSEVMGQGFARRTI